MNKLIISLLIISSFAFSTEICNVNGSNNGMPEGSCVQTGYVCNLAFDVNNDQKVMSFNLGTDQTCATPISTKFTTVKVDGTSTNVLWPFLIEGEQYKTDALAMTLAGSLALSASNNKVPVSVIYHQVKSSNYGGVLLQSITQVGN